MVQQFVSYNTVASYSGVVSYNSVVGVDTLGFMLLTNIGNLLDLLNYQCCATAAGQGDPVGSPNA